MLALLLDQSLAGLETLLPDRKAADWSQDDSLAVPPWIRSCAVAILERQYRLSTSERRVAVRQEHRLTAIRP